jgi:hypothetical protein
MKYREKDTNRVIDAVQVTEYMLEQFPTWARRRLLFGCDKGNCYFITPGLWMLHYNGQIDLKTDHIFQEAYDPIEKAGNERKVRVEQNQKVCKNCKWYASWSRECRRHAPSVHVYETVTRPGPMSGPIEPRRKEIASTKFPEVGSSDWCGEFEPAEEDSP